MQKIALIQARYSIGGGMDAYLADLIRGFRAVGDQVDVWVYEKNPELPVPEGVRIRTVELKPFLKALKKTAYFTQIAKPIRRSDYDLVIGLIRTAKQDINVNGGTHIGFARNVNGSLRYTDILPIFFEWKTLRSSRAIVAHSRKIAEEIHRYYKTPLRKIHTLYPPVDDRRFHPGLRKKRAELRKKYGIKEGPLTVFFPSTNYKIKGLDPLLKAFSLLPPGEFQLLIAGAPLTPGDLPPNIRFLGFSSQIEELYAASDLTILPSFYDGFGLVITESLACGTPVAVSSQAGASEVVEPRHGIILHDLSPEGIAAAIRQARETRFEIEPDFLRRHGMTVDQHIEALRRIDQTLRLNRF